MRYLPDAPEGAAWLTRDERRARLDDVDAGALHSAQGLLNVPVRGLGLVDFLVVLAIYGFAVWAPPC